MQLIINAAMAQGGYWDLWMKCSFGLIDVVVAACLCPQAPMSGAPVALLPTLRSMLAHSPSLRPPAVSFTAAGYFQACGPLPKNPGCPLDVRPNAVATLHVSYIS